MTHSIPAGERFRRHEHAGVHVCAVLAGGFAEREGSSWRDVAPGTIRVSSDARHDIDFGRDGARCLLLLPAPGAAVPAALGLHKAAFLPAHGWLGAVLRRVDAVMAANDPANAAVFDSLATELLAQLERVLDGRRTLPPPWLARIRELIDDTNGAPTVHALAVEAGVHRVHLARVFREHLGVAVSDYARRARLRGALRLLATTSVPLSMVAHRGGYADQSHLSRDLRAALGTTPAAFRRATLHRFKTHPVRHW